LRIPEDCAADWKADRQGGKVLFPMSLVQETAADSGSAAVQQRGGRGRWWRESPEACA